MTERGVLIIGGNSEIAIAIADRFERAGDRVVGVGLQYSAASSYLDFLVADCSDPTQAAAAVQSAHETLGQLDVVVLAAARMPTASAISTTDEAWRESLGATLDSAFFIARAALPTLARGSSIVAITSTNATLAAPGLPAYSAAKAGVEGLVRQLALEYGHQGIRANAVAPGNISSIDTGESEGYPLGRIGTPDEVAGAVFFLSSDEASFITGVTLMVDGGLSISSPAAWLRPDLRARWL